MRPEKTVFVLLLVACVTAAASVNKNQLYFSYITTIASKQITASGGIPAVDLALEDINRNSSILANYTLNYTTVLDSGCTETQGLDSFFYHFKNSSQPTYVSMLCCGCSTATIPVAEISHHWNVAHMAYAAAASVLNNRQKYRNFFRALPSFDNLAPSVGAIMDYYNWTQMLVFTQQESLFLSVTDTLEKVFLTHDWTLQDIVIPTGASPFPYEEAFNWDEDFRIFYINSYPPQAFSLLCEAYWRELVSPNYVWIVQGWYPSGWWNTTENSSCTPDVMLAALNRTLAIIPDGYFVNEDTSARAISNLTSDEFDQEYKDLLDSAEYEEYNPLSIKGVAYDAVWAMALGLDKAAERVQLGNDSGCEGFPGNLVPLEEFNYSNAKMGCIFEQSFREARFIGVTGDIYFNENGSRTDNVILLQQYRTKDEFSLTYVADIKILNLTNYQFVYRPPEDSSTVWEESVPYDGATVENIVSSDLVILGVFYTLASIGVIFTIGCLIFNIVLRNRKIVKLSSPNLNYFLITGAGMLYVCIYLYTYLFDGQIQTIFCNIRLWLFSLGYTLCFAVILAKTWRVYYIFSNPSAKKKAIKDWILVMIIGAVVTVDTVLLFLGTAIPKTRLNATLVVDEENPTTVNDKGINIENFVYICSSTGAIAWIAVLYSYKVLLQIVAMFMAFHTRKVRIKALNDSKEIAVIVYINSLTLILLVVIEFALNKRYLLYTSLFALALFVGASVFLGLVFVPKAVSLLRDPQGKYIFSSNGTGNEAAAQAYNALQRKNSSMEFGKSSNKGNELDPTNIPERKDSFLLKPAEPVKFNLANGSIDDAHQENSEASKDQNTESVKL